MTNEDEIIEQFAQVEEGDFVRILYSKQKNMVTLRAGYAYDIKDHDDYSTTFNLCTEQNSRYGLLIRIRQNALLGLEPSEILKVQVQKRRPEDEKKLESILGTKNDKK